MDNLIRALLVADGLVLFFIVLYLLAIMPRMKRRPNLAPFKGWLYAHRGLHDNMSEAPENSMAAFLGAVEAGYGIELDIQLTKDKLPVVFHDFSLKRVCGAEGNICDFTFEELQQFTLKDSKERIPLFTDVLALVDGRVPLIVEFKNEQTDMELCGIANKILREYKGVYCMESFNPLCVQWYRKNDPRVVRGQLSKVFWKADADGTPARRTPLYFALQHLLLNFLAKPDFIAYDHHSPNTLSRRICCNAYGCMAVAWTIKSQAELDRARHYFELFIFDSFIPKK